MSKEKKFKTEGPIEEIDKKRILNVCNLCPLKQGDVRNATIRKDYGRNACSVRGFNECNQIISSEAYSQMRREPRPVYGPGGDQIGTYYRRRRTKPRNE